MTAIKLVDNRKTQHSSYVYKEGGLTVTVYSRTKKVLTYKDINWALDAAKDRLLERART